MRSVEKTSDWNLFLLSRSIADRAKAIVVVKISDSAAVKSLKHSKADSWSGCMYVCSRASAAL
jgi:hypothetical protein